MIATCLFFRVFLALLAASMLAATTYVANSTWMLDHLMSMLARSKSGRITLAKTRMLSIAAQPIESLDELVFVAPNHLEKHTLAPKPGYLVIDGDRLIVERNQHKFMILLSQYPELGVFTESIRAALAGNRYALEAIYKAAITSHGDDWMLTLSPIDTRMQQVARTVTLEGMHDVLCSVAIRQTDGDHSLMCLQRVLGG